MISKVMLLCSNQTQLNKLTYCQSCPTKFAFKPNERKLKTTITLVIYMVEANIRINDPFEGQQEGFRQVKKLMILRLHSI